ncbi:DUF1833 family protein [Schauerella aestuarii]|uniref:DUF1833 family protein n=1 Tax=Schauerella aestuarii TaxID=2511204 RepID=UPI00136A4C0C|nr:DUF1833 family protein [Achromobacter aestuarii]MYZ44221.1 DUF1833 domain-containing protein [Achromobacter aestuarii]
MRNISLSGRRNILATSSTEPMLVLLEITHVDLVVAIRVVNNTESIVSQGNTFLATAFELLLPDDIEGQIPQATLSVDNIGQQLTQWLEVSRGGQGARCRMMMVAPSLPNLLEYDMTMDMTGLKIDNQKVSAQLGFVNTLGRSAVAKTFNPQSAPGLW